MKKFIVVLLLLASTLGFAKIPLPKENTYVNDFAHVLTKKEIKALNKRIRVFENRTSVQLAVVLVNYLPEGYTIEEYALLIGRKWRGGTVNNGLVYVAAIKERQQRLEVADSLQKYISDKQAANILDWVKIDLKYEFYSDAVKTLVVQTDSTIKESKLELARVKASAEMEKRTAESGTQIDSMAESEGDKEAGIIGTVITWIILTLFLGLPVLIIFLFILMKLLGVRSGTSLSGTGTNTYSSYRDAGYNSVSAGAAASYSAARRVVKRTVYKSRPVHHHTTHHHTTSSYRAPEPEPEPEPDVNDERQYGKWGSSSSRGSSSSSSSNSGFNGGGATSDW